MDASVMKIDRPGIFKNFDTEAYFADPCPTPSLSQSIAKILIEQSPLHARLAHPKFALPADEEEPEKYDKAKAIGNAAHALLLDRGKKMAVGDFADWRKKEAQAFKDEALSAGREPILKKHMALAEQMVLAARGKLLCTPGCDNAFTAGDAEVVVANCENGLWLKSMVDWITPDLREVWDYKTTGASASPYAMSAKMANDGWHIQAAMIERILDALDPAGAGRRVFRFVCQENAPPFALTVNELGEAALTMGRKMVEYAAARWRECLAEDFWLDYPARIIRPEFPGWKENAWLEREVKEDEERHEPRVPKQIALAGG
jgi:hypothetical protein